MRQYQGWEKGDLICQHGDLFEDENGPLIDEKGIAHAEVMGFILDEPPENDDEFRVFFFRAGMSYRGTKNRPCVMRMNRYVLARNYVVLARVGDSANINSEGR